MPLVLLAESKIPIGSNSAEQLLGESRHAKVTSKSPHTILKKQKIWGTFHFFIFSVVRGQAIPNATGARKHPSTEAKF